MLCITILFVSLLALLLTTSRHNAQARIVNIRWDVSYTFANPDGLYTRRVVGVNGNWPPPPIVVFSGDVLRLNVHNRLDQPTAIHHHGIDFRGAGIFDGAFGLTQCGIPPGEDFTYEVDTKTQSGTYWIHAHSYGHYVDGLRSPLIIQPPLQATSSSQRSLDTKLTMQTVSQAYDEEYTVIMSDWYHDQHNDLLNQYLSPSNPDGQEATPDSGLLYFSKGTTYLPGFNSAASIQFVPNKRYRLRLMNIGAIATFHFKIDGHDMYIMEVDGTDVQPYKVDSIPIDVAQRYSIVVTAKADASTNYLIHANMDKDMFMNASPSTRFNNNSTLVYSPGAPLHPAEPFSPDSYMTFDERVLTPEIPQAILTPTREINLDAAFYLATDNINRGFMNNVTWIPPNVPTIMTVESVQPDLLYDPRIYGPQTNVYILQYMEVIDLVVKNSDTGGHPFHLHGHKFQVIDRTMGDVNMKGGRSNQALSVLNSENPVRRDTFHIEPEETVRIRFRADNPNVLLFHCHIEWHLQAGLAITIVEAPDRLQQQIRGGIPSQMRNQCTRTGRESQGNAAGNSGDRIFDISGAPQGPHPQP